MGLVVRSPSHAAREAPPAMPTSDQGALAAGTMIAGCRVVRLLGKGGMGEVYLAHHLRLDKQVAIKILPPAAVGTDQAVPRFQREARLAARISHPNVIKILDVGREGSDHFILMDFVAGTNLTDLVRKQGGPLPWRHALRLVQLAARGVGAVHKQELIHRDIKPANIMLSADRQVLLMDFGLAREVAGSEVTRGRALLGTPGFMSPEQSRAEPLDCRSDIFALGSTLYYLLTARYPFEGTGHAVMFQIASGCRPTPVRDVNPFVPAAVSDFVARLMSPDKADRPASTDALGAEIRRLSALPEAPPQPGSETSNGSARKTGPSVVPELDLVPLETVPDPSRRAQRFLPWALAGVAACLMVAVIVLASGGCPRPPGPGPGPNPGPTPQPEPTPPPPPPGMVYVPAGKVQLGNTEEEIMSHFRTPEMKAAKITQTSFRDHSTFPPRTETVPAFFIDQYEVTAAEYARFVEKTGRSPPKPWTGNRPPAGREQYPVTWVTHADAAAYAEWAGKKLPTERQWVRAFRDDKNWFYPWGNEWDASRAVVYENRAFGICAPVDASPRDVSPFKVFNLAGNAGELMRDPILRGGQDVYVVHGPLHDPGDCLRAMASSFGLMTATATDDATGFRCVVEIP